MSSTYTIFDAKTRQAVSCVTCRKSALAAHTRDGQIAIEGRHRGAVRLNAANEVEHDVERTSAVDRDRVRAARQAQIEQLERQQLRSLRELAINPANAEARRRLNEIEVTITAAREQLE